MKDNDLKPLISVIIPYYNDGLYIEETIDSILNQTYKNVEIIIINDGSTDSFSIEKLNNLNKSKTRVIHQQNAGGAVARNKGFQNAISEYVLTLDSDDKFENSFLEKAIDILEKNNKVAAVSAWAKGFGERDFLWQLTGGTIKNFVYGNQCIACALIRKSIWQQIGGYREELRNAYEDWDFWLRVTDLGYEIYVIPEPLFLYRQKNSSMLLETQKKHTQIYAQVLNLNKNIFEKYALELLIDKEKKIYQELKKLEERDITINQLLNSKEYKLGILFIKPFKKIVGLFKNKI